MKKPFLYLLLLISFISCSDNVKFNNPTFEGQKDNVRWRASDAKATLVNGILTIEGFARNEKLTFVIPAPTTVVSHNDKNTYVTYLLGTSTTTTATYVMSGFSGETTFLTGLGIGDGKIVITGYDGVNNVVSGTFVFNAKNSNSNSLAEPKLNFQNGNFYMSLK